MRNLIYAAGVLLIAVSACGGSAPRTGSSSSSSGSGPAATATTPAVLALHQAGEPWVGLYGNVANQDQGDSVCLGQQTQLAAQIHQITSSLPTGQELAGYVKSSSGKTAVLIALEYGTPQFPNQEFLPQFLGAIASGPPLMQQATNMSDTGSEYNDTSVVVCAVIL